MRSANQTVVNDSLRKWQRSLLVWANRGEVTEYLAKNLISSVNVWRSSLLSTYLNTAVQVSPYRHLSSRQLQDSWLDEAAAVEPVIRVIC